MSKVEAINRLLPKLAIMEEKTWETADTCSLKITMAEDENFSFSPGQFNILGLPGYGEAAISFSSLVMNNKSFFHTIRLVGNVTRAICQLNKGDKLTVRGPYGNGWPLEKAAEKNLIIVAGGIGMAPLRSVIYYLLQNRKRFGKVFLLYGAKNEEYILYKEEIKSWSELTDISMWLSVDEKPKEKFLDLQVGVVTTLLNKIDVPLSDSLTFTCGPELMMRFVARNLILKGQSGNDIFVSLERRMKCGIAHCGHCQIGAKYVCKDGPVFSYSDIKRFADTLL